MNLYRQNIKILEEKGVDPRVYYLQKLAEETKELHDECWNVLDKCYVQDFGKNEALKSEIADVMNCETYLNILIYGEEWGQRVKIMDEKLKRALKREEVEDE